MMRPSRGVLACVSLGLLCGRDSVGAEKDPRSRSEQLST